MTLSDHLVSLVLILYYQRSVLLAAILHTVHTRTKTLLCQSTFNFKPSDNLPVGFLQLRGKQYSGHNGAKAVINVHNLSGL